MTPLTLGPWNVYMLNDHDGADWPEWRTALTAKELARYNVQIAAFGKTWLAEEGQLSKLDLGYTFFSIGCSGYVCCEVGLGFAIKSNLVNKLSVPPNGVYDHLMRVQLPVSGKQHATLVSTMPQPWQILMMPRKGFTKTSSQQQL